MIYQAAGFTLRMRETEFPSFLGTGMPPIFGAACFGDSGRDTVVEVQALITLSQIRIWDMVGTGRHLRGPTLPRA